MGTKLYSAVRGVARIIRVFRWPVIALVGGSLILDALKITHWPHRGWEHTDTAIMVYGFLFGVGLVVFLVSLFLARYSGQSRVRILKKSENK